jgi:phage shock protein A
MANELPFDLLQTRLTNEMMLRRSLQKQVEEKQRLLDQACDKNNGLEQRIAELERKLEQKRADGQKPTVIRRF